jgi:cobalt-zinc-cadmium efflux system outer membrane protein
MFMLAACLTPGVFAQQAFTWAQLKDKFEAENPTLRAGKIGIDEAKAAEITAYLRPNPDLALSTDGTQISRRDGVWRPFAGTQFSPAISYLHEREHKRELRLESAKEGTGVAEWQQADLERNLLLNLRGAFVQTLQAKAVRALARENLEYYDKLLAVSRDRCQAGDIAQMDLDRLELQRVQYESDVQIAEVSLRTSKIQLLMLLNDPTPIEQFDVAGPFDFPEQVPGKEEFRAIAQDARPDLKAALEALDKAQTDYKLAVADGSADPTSSVWWTHNPSFNNPYDYNTAGASVTIPLRIFDRNQGEKLRTQLDIARNERLRDAIRAQVFNDVDSAWERLNGNLTLLRPYKAKYLQQAVRVRDTVSFAYQHGGASLLDFLQAQQDYRSIQLSYLNLIGSYLTAASQLNLAVGREAIQ